MPTNSSAFKTKSQVQRCIVGLQRRLHSSAWLILIGMAVAQVLGIWWWQAELFTHFSFFAALYLIVAACCIAQRSRYLFGLVGAAVCIWGLLPATYWGQFDTPKAPKYTVLSYNVALHNPKPAAEVAFMRQTNADILLLAEAGGQWQPHLTNLKTQYPHGCGHNDNSPFALHLLAKQALQSCHVYFIAGLPYIRAQTTDHTVLYAMHPPPPIQADLAHARLAYFKHTAQRIQAETGLVIVAGDLNNTAFSPIHRRFTQTAGLQSITFRALPTWKPFFLPIDHVLTNAQPMHVVQVRALDWQFSDHRPLLFSW